MQVVTIKAKPKVIIGIILLLIGAAVIVFTFLSNHSAKTVIGKTQSIVLKTKEERLEYIKSLGWEIDGDEKSKQITIPEEFNDVYESYNSIQKSQGFNLEKYKGKTAVIYTYSIKNYKNNKNIIADLIVCGNTLIGADLCDPAADGGFLKELGHNDSKT